MRGSRSPRASQSVGSVEHALARLASVHKRWTTFRAGSPLLVMRNARTMHLGSVQRHVNGGPTISREFNTAWAAYAASQHAWAARRRRSEASKMVAVHAVHVPCVRRGGAQARTTGYEVG